MQHWEYEVLTFSADDAESKPHHMAGDLHKEGSQGWEVISVVPILGPAGKSEGPTVTRTLVVTLKRPKT